LSGLLDGLGTDGRLFLLFGDEFYDFGVRHVSVCSIRVVV
jgi:hypothetical protein